MTVRLASVEGELQRLEREDKEIDRELAAIQKRQEPMERISEDATAFIRTWQDVGELLDAATHEERLLILRHYVEVIELHATDPKGKSGTYALRLFPEVSPDRGFDWREDVPQIGPGDGSPASETQNGAVTQEGDDPELLTDSDLVCMTDGKAPRKGPSSKQCAPIFARSDRRNLLLGNEFPFSETQIGVIDR